MKIKNITLFIIIFIAVSANRQGAGELTGQVDPDAIRRHAEYLSDDLLQGRGAGTPGEHLAGDYLAQQFQNFGLDPAGDNHTFFQNIQMHGSTPLPQSQLLIYHDPDTGSLALEHDYLLFKYGAQTLVPKPVDMVFVGYGIAAPEFDYNDYQALDVNDKIVVYLSGEPFSTDKDYFAGTEPTIYSYPESKERIAISRGARGSILLPNPDRDPEWDHYVQSYAFEDITLAYSVTSHLGLIINPSTADILFKNSPYTSADIYRMDAENDIKSFELNTSLSFRGQFKQRDFISRNVLALLPGGDPKLKDSYLIVTAHYDHLGIGAHVLGDSIYNGFGDNALGCAGLLELARVLSSNPGSVKRSILFLMVTGEEKGLLGSTYYIDHPVVPLYRSAANLNIDGLAMFDEFNDIVGVGQELSDLGGLLNSAAKEMGLSVSPVPSQFLRSESFARSDQISFAKAGIPSLIVMDGLNYRNLSPVQGLQLYMNWMKHVYHTPFDDSDQNMNYLAAGQHCRVLLNVIIKIANSDREPQWKPGNPYINARLQTRAEKR